MDKKYYIADFGNYGQGEAVSLDISKKGNVLAEYTDNPIYFDTKEEAEELLQEVQERTWDYSFSLNKHIREQYIQAENLKIVECNFDE